MSSECVNFPYLSMVGFILFCIRCVASHAVKPGKNTRNNKSGWLDVSTVYTMRSNTMVRFGHCSVYVLLKGEVRVECVPPPPLPPNNIPWQYKPTNQISYKSIAFSECIWPRN